MVIMEKESKGLSLDYLAEHYDKITPAEKSKFRRKQIDMLNLRKGEKVLEVGCGTGALSILAKRVTGETGIVQGMDLAPKMIAKAQSKARASNLEIGFQCASIDALPYPDEFFDAVISSFMYHHLPVELKPRGLEEIYRVLKKGGRFFLCDFCSPHYLTMPLMYIMLMWMVSTRHQLFGKLPGMIEESSFGHTKLIKKGWFLEYYLMTKAK
jgi:ubiquinone/menaquinone biosynthesis C-methylase UbiE